MYTSEFVKELTSLGVAFRDRLLLLLLVLLLLPLLLLLLPLHLLLFRFRRRRWESFFRFAVWHSKVSKLAAL